MPFIFQVHSYGFDGSAQAAGTLHLFRLLTPKYLQFFSCGFQHPSHCSTVLTKCPARYLLFKTISITAGSPSVSKEANPPFRLLWDTQSAHLDHSEQQRQEATGPAAPSCHRWLPCPGHCPPTGCHPATAVRSATTLWLWAHPATTSLRQGLTPVLTSAISLRTITCRRLLAGF